MSTSHFALGVADKRAGRGYRDAYATWGIDDQWNYERTRPGLGGFGATVSAASPQQQTQPGGDQVVSWRYSVNVPIIQSVGPPPALHADRVTAEMFKCIVATHITLWRDIGGTFRNGSLGNPIGQQRLVPRLGAIGGAFLPVCRAGSRSP
jgi:hypothetical protein